MKQQHDDELEILEKTQAVLHTGGPVESPGTLVPGPYYASSEEVLPELETPKEVSGSIDEKNAEFPVDRRDFMKLFGLGGLAAGAASCVRRPAEHAIPYVNQPVDQMPGIPVEYATTCGACSNGCGLMVKTKGGRPTKIEGSQEHPISRGALCALGQAQTQALYHPERLKKPLVRYRKRLDSVDWDKIYPQLAEKLQEAKNPAIITGGSTGHRHIFYQEWLNRLGFFKSNLYTWESNSLFSATAKANELAFGHKGVPRVDLEKANYILGIGSDFLDVGISSLYQTRGFADSHSYRNGKKGKFVQLESHLTLTGAKADTRLIIPPGSELVCSLLLLRALSENVSAKGSLRVKEEVRKILSQNRSILLDGYDQVGISRETFDNLATDLLKQTSVLMTGGTGNSGEDGTLLQLVGILGNLLIGSYGVVMFQDKGWQNAPVQTNDLDRFIDNIDSHDLLLIIDCDPVSTTPEAWGLKNLISKVPTVVSIQPFPQEVDEFAHFVLPANHFLESWGDEQPIHGFWSLRQPVIRAATGSRQAEDILLWLLASVGKSLPYENYRSFLYKQWKSVYKSIGSDLDYKMFFQFSLKRGFAGHLKSRSVGSLKKVSSYFHHVDMPEPGLKVSSPLDPKLLDGRGAHLPVLQEVGDCLTTIAWDTPIAMSPILMKDMGLKVNQVVEVKSSAGSLEGAVYPLPGLHPNSVIITQGNGQNNKRSTISHKNGLNPLTLFPKKADPLSGQPVTCHQPVTIKPTGKWYRLAMMQKHNDIANRVDIVKKYSLKKMKKLPKKVDVDTVPDVFPKLQEMTYRWGMSIDLDRCNGCGACMTACAIENNVPQVGREQVLLGREMHWIRMDRYFYGDIEEPVVTFQPVMCQHCNHAPCEAVCPVFATAHDPEGLNAMTYNRCVGTRYCANACPYKVRRFNWWTHKWGTMGERAQDRNPRPSNPDVTVRTAGVMEKCTMCVGRIRDGKHKAKLAGRQVIDGEIKTACQQTCAAGAITFGNLNDPNSQVTQDRSDPRSFLMLGGDPAHGHYGLKTLPNVNYLAEVTFDEPASGFGPDQSAYGHHGKESHGKKEEGHH